MDLSRVFAQMAKGFQTEGTSMNHPPEIDSTLPDTYDPDISTVPFMNNHVTNANTTSTNNNNEGNPEIKSNNEESEKKSDESAK